ncbi:MAG: neutral zinc metallopeptidase [Georgenia sp.]
MLVISLLTGQDLSGLLGGGEPAGPAAPVVGGFEHCRTGADANEFTDCRMLDTADALDVFWEPTLPEQAGIEYVMPGFEVFEGSVSTGCGSATSAVGPFHCPTDSNVYLDIGFFDQRETRLGAENAPLAQMYMVAHEWGHHIQNQQGTMATVDRQRTGPGSGVHDPAATPAGGRLFRGDPLPLPPHHPGPPHRAREPKRRLRALSVAEEAEILTVQHSERFVDMAPVEIPPAPTGRCTPRR